MQELQSICLTWANILRERKLKKITITLLEAAGPFKILAAQLLYAGMPLLEIFTPSKSIWFEMANLLEDNQHSRSFVAYLRGEVE